MSALARAAILAATLAVTLALGVHAARADDPPLPTAPTPPAPPSAPAPPASPDGIAVSTARALVTNVRESNGAGVVLLVASIAPNVRYEVLRRLIEEEISGPDPRDAFAAYAEAVRAADPGVAANASAWTAASLEQIARERVLEARCRREVGSAPAATPSVAEATKWVDATADLELDPASPSLAVSELLLLRARGYRRLGRIEECEALAAALGRYAAAHRLDDLVVRATREQGDALRGLKRRPEAIAAYLVAAEAARRLDDGPVERACLVTASVLLDFEGATARARDVLVRIRALNAADVPPDRAARFDMQLARAEIELGDVTVARVLIRGVMADAEARHSAELLQFAQKEWISLCVSEGRLAEAVKATDAALAAAPDPAAGPDVWALWIYAARVHLATGRVARADELLTRLRAAIEARPVREPTALAHVDLDRAEVCRRLGRLDEARALGASALATYRASGHRILTLDAALALANLELRTGRTKEAHALLPELRSIVAPMASRRRMDELHLEARLALAEGDAPAAIRLSHEALDVGRTIEGFQTGQFGLYATLAAALLATDRPLDALVALEAAAALLVDGTRGLVESESSRMRAAAADVSRGAAAVLRAVAAQRPSTVRDILARVWRVRELGNALLLASDVARGPEPTPTPAEMEALRARGRALDALARAEADLVIRATSAVADAEAQQAARTAVDAAHERVLDALSRCRRTGEVAALDAGLVSLAEFERTLAPGTALLEFADDGTGLVAIVCRRDGARVFDLGPVAGLDDQVAAWLELVSTAGGPHEVLGRRLHERLFAPLTPALDGIDRLLVMAEGRLAQMPLDAVLDERGAPLVERYEIASIPSATTFVELSRRAVARAPGRGLIAVADPARPDGARGSILPSLAGTRAEVAAVAASHALGSQRILVGEEATLDAFEAALTSVDGTPWRAIHVACHGWLDPIRPRLGGVLLAGGAVWNVERLEGRTLLVDLVVLSACDTIGSSWEDGEGLVGLVRPLLRAGATRVIASAWRVPDGSTADLLADFHRRWAVDAASPGAALREAKLALRRRGARFAHPYAWAPFVLCGVPSER